jgi:alkylhydroperoxidase family enzyme
MAWIPYVPNDHASGLLAQLYDEYSNERGELDHILRIHSLNPRSMRDHMELYSHLMRGGSPLSRVQREMIALSVSAENHCFY